MGSRKTEKRPLACCIEFPSRTPNAKTIAAFKELQQGKGKKCSLEQFRKMMKNIKEEST